MTLRFPRFASSAAHALRRPSPLSLLPSYSRLFIPAIHHVPSFSPRRPSSTVSPRPLTPVPKVAATIQYDLDDQSPVYLHFPSHLFHSLLSSFRSNFHPVSSLPASPLRIKLNKQLPIHGMLLQIANDVGAPNAVIYTMEDGVRVRWSSSTSIHDLLCHSLQSSHQQFHIVFAPDQPHSSVTVPVILPSFTERTRHLHDQLSVLQPKLAHLHTIKRNIETHATQMADRSIWAGLGFLCAQWGLMARLTWWEYSWDVMEPIAYFLSFGTGIMGYMFYVITRREHTYETQTGLIVDLRAKALYAKHGLDLVEYNAISDKVISVKDTINKVCDEYGLPHISSSMTSTPTTLL